MTTSFGSNYIVSQLRLNLNFNVLFDVIPALVPSGSILVLAPSLNHQGPTHAASDNEPDTPLRR